MRFPDLSEPWRQKNWRESRSEKSSSGERYWAQSCHCSCSCSSISVSCCFDKKGRASIPKSDANTITERSSDGGHELPIFFFFDPSKFSDSHTSIVCVACMLDRMCIRGFCFRVWLRIWGVRRVKIRGIILLALLYL